MPSEAPTLDRVRRVRRETLRLTGDLDQERLDRRPSPRRWSVGEVLDHLILSDRFYRGDVERLFELARAGERPVLRRSFADLDPSILFFPKRLLPLLEPPLAVMNLFMPRSLRDWIARNRLIPAQNPEISEPRPGRPAEELRHELAESLEETEAVFRDAEGLDLTAIEHYHPLLGKRDLAGLLDFIADHEERHQAQIREILSTRGRPDRPGRTGAADSEGG